ncbi:hypothetical protein Syun_029794 [Stephania yunnanensis]|uniref:WDR11 second beta-propeller domain-containing protein n=1 Tax=Stephania yunnanensis TaxID=152371 RepID=A0AAP0E630_9MAGN
MSPLQPPSSSSPPKSPNPTASRRTKTPNPFIVSRLYSCLSDRLVKFVVDQKPQIPSSSRLVSVSPLYSRLSDRLVSVSSPLSTLVSPSLAQPVALVSPSLSGHRPPNPQPPTNLSSRSLALNSLSLGLSRLLLNHHSGVSVSLGLSVSLWSPPPKSPTPNKSSSHSFAPWLRCPALVVIALIRSSRALFQSAPLLLSALTSCSHSVPSLISLLSHCALIQSALRFVSLVQPIAAGELLPERLGDPDCPGAGVDISLLPERPSEPPCSVRLGFTSCAPCKVQPYGCGVGVGFLSFKAFHISWLPKLCSVQASFYVHNGIVRGFRWLGNSRLVTFSYTQANEKAGGYTHILVVTRVISGLNRIFRVMRKPERAPIRALRASSSGRESEKQLSLLSNGRHINHGLTSGLVERFIGWALPLLRDVGGDGSIELALEGIREFLNVGEASGIEVYISPILKACQGLLENERTSLSLLHQLLGVLSLIYVKFARWFQPHFVDIIDLLLGWALVPDLSKSDRCVIMDSFLQFTKHWLNNLQFSLRLLSKFLDDMDVLLKDGSAGTPEQFRRLLALVSCFLTVLKATVAEMLEMKFLEQISQPLISMVPKLSSCLSLVGKKFGWSSSSDSWSTQERSATLASFILDKLDPFTLPVQSNVELQVTVIKTLAKLSQVEFLSKCYILRRLAQNGTA